MCADAAGEKGRPVKHSTEPAWDVWGEGEGAERPLFKERLTKEKTDETYGAYLCRFIINVSFTSSSLYFQWAKVNVTEPT